MKKILVTLFLGCVVMLYSYGQDSLKISLEDYHFLRSIIEKDRLDREEFAINKESFRVELNTAIGHVANLERYYGEYRESDLGKGIVEEAVAINNIASSRSSLGTDITKNILADAERIFKLEPEENETENQAAIRESTNTRFGNILRTIASNNFIRNLASSNPITGIGFSIINQASSFIRGTFEGEEVTLGSSGLPGFNNWDRAWAKARTNMLKSNIESLLQGKANGDVVIDNPFSSKINEFALELDKHLKIYNDLDSINNLARSELSINEKTKRDKYIENFIIEFYKMIDPDIDTLNDELRANIVNIARQETDVSTFENPGVVGRMDTEKISKKAQQLKSEVIDSKNRIYRSYLKMFDGYISILSGYRRDYPTNTSELDHTIDKLRNLKSEVCSRIENHSNCSD